MKKIISILCFVISIILISGCQSNNNKTVIKEDTMEEFKDTIIITINDKSFHATLEDNETSREFIQKLPLELVMNELNGNEKYVYLDSSLPTKSSNPKHINAGDIMLYGNDCLVIFYKSFDTNYNYTKIGHIDNLPDLGNDNITIKFEKK